MGIGRCRRIGNNTYSALIFFACAGTLGGRATGTTGVGGAFGVAGFACGCTRRNANDWVNQNKQVLHVNTSLQFTHATTYTRISANRRSTALCRVCSCCFTHNCCSFFGLHLPDIPSIACTGNAKTFDCSGYPATAGTEKAIPNATYDIGIIFQSSPSFTGNSFAASHSSSSGHLYYAIS